MARSEKNPRPISAIPNHIHGSRKDCRTNLRIDLGRKSWTSPTLFMARLTHNSPAVPDTTIKNRSEISSTVKRSCCAGRGTTHEENTETNHGDSKPAQGGNDFSEKKVTKDGNGEVGQRCGGLHITVVCPGQQQHVDDEKSQ